jgi:cytidylate kinase
MTTPITDLTHLDRLIDRQQRMWDVRKALANEGGAAARREGAHLPEGPWITISTEMGSRGEEVGRRAAEILGWQVFDKEVLTAIATHADRRERLLAGYDEHPVSTLRDLVSHLLVPGHTARPAYELELIRVIVAVGRQGRAVLVGRGANWALDARYGLRVRFVAPKEARVALVAETLGMDHDEAAKVVEKDDTAKRGWIHQVYRREIADPLGYDVMVNTAEMDVETAAATVVAALRSKIDMARHPAGDPVR